MTSSIFYKFRSSKENFVLPFEGNSLSLKDFTSAIIEQKKLPIDEKSEFRVSDARTGEVFRHDGRNIPKNTSLILIRVPTKKGSSIRMNSSIPGLSGIMPQKSNLSEVEKMKGILGQGINTSGNNSSSMMSSYGQNSGMNKGMGFRKTNFNRPNTMGRVPPPGYVCHRCRQTGHFIQHCPTNGNPNFDLKKVRPATGIPRAFLRAVNTNQISEADGAVVIPGGQIAVVQPNEKEFEKKVSQAGMENEFFGSNPPDELKCSVCNDIIKEAVLVVCCGESFCNSCLTQDNNPSTSYNRGVGSGLVCPACNTNIGIHDIIVNKKVRLFVDLWRRLRLNKKSPQGNKGIDRDQINNLNINNDNLQNGENTNNNNYQMKNSMPIPTQTSYVTNSVPHPPIFKPPVLITNDQNMNTFRRGFNNNMNQNSTTVLLSRSEEETIPKNKSKNSNKENRYGKNSRNERREYKKQRDGYYNNRRDYDRDYRRDRDREHDRDRVKKRERGYEDNYERKRRKH